MSNEMMMFENEEFGKVRAVEVDGDPWFVGNDVAAFIHDHPGPQRADLQLIMAGAVKSTVIDVNHRRGGAAYCLVITGRRFICAVELRRSQLIELT